MDQKLNIELLNSHRNQSEQTKGSCNGKQKRLHTKTQLKVVFSCSINGILESQKGQQ